MQIRCFLIFLPMSRGCALKMHTLKDSDTSVADRRVPRPLSVLPHTGAIPLAWVSSPRGYPFPLRPLLRVRVIHSGLNADRDNRPHFLHRNIPFTASLSNTVSSSIAASRFFMNSIPACLPHYNRVIPFWEIVCLPIVTIIAPFWELE